MDVHRALFIYICRMKNELIPSQSTMNTSRQLPCKHNCNPSLWSCQHPCKFFDSLNERQPDASILKHVYVRMNRLTVIA